MTTQTFTQAGFVDHVHGGGSVTITSTTKGGIIPMFDGGGGTFTTLARAGGLKVVNQGDFECGAGTIRVHVTDNAVPTASHPVTVTIS